MKQPPYIVEVTTQDIERGKPFECRVCPVNIALERVTDRLCRTSSRICEIAGIDYILPYEAHKFISDFDRNNPVQPFTFTISELWTGKEQL